MTIRRHSFLSSRSLWRSCIKKLIFSASVSLSHPAHGLSAIPATMRTGRLSLGTARSPYLQTRQQVRRNEVQCRQRLHQLDRRLRVRRTLAGYRHILRLRGGAAEHPAAKQQDGPLIPDTRYECLQGASPVGRTLDPMLPLERWPLGSPCPGNSGTRPSLDPAAPGRHQVGR